MICRICNNSKSFNKFSVKEMMFGFRDNFVYLECPYCGCLQIADIPKNINKYYPSDYYSIKEIRSDNNLFFNLIKNIIRKKRNKYILFKKGILGKLFKSIRTNEDLELIAKSNVIITSRILDVGCGKGELIYFLKDIGFRNLIGVDPYIKRDKIEHGIAILKKSIADLSDEKKFDLIMFHHSFEHFPSQLEILLKVNKLLSKNGICLICMPVKTEYIWNNYGPYWIQLDAPRHFIIHTLKSFDLLVKKFGFFIENVIFNSTEFQFWGSEQYKQDIPLFGEFSYLVSRKKSIFKRKDIKKYRKLSKDLNNNEQGDQACFYLKRGQVNYPKSVLDNQMLKI